MKALLLALTQIFSIRVVNVDTITGKVIRVADGDTIPILDSSNT